MKIVLPGGTGNVGGFLSRALAAAGHEVVVLSRRGGVDLGGGVRSVVWDARTPGPWTAEVDGADAVVNLAGRSVSCRYTEENLREMLESRVDSTRVVGEAVAAASAPPGVWLQMSTATIYAHRHDAPNDEATGIIGGGEPGVPDYWAFSVEIAKRWEEAQREAVTPRTRKVALRTAMVMSPDRGSVFDVLSWMARLGLGGSVAGGRQFVSWIHADDFRRAVEFLLTREDVEGPVNLAAPDPLPQREFGRVLRRAWRMPVGLPATSRMAGIGAFVLRSDTELLLKSRRVVPTRLSEAGFTFDFPRWETAAADLVRAVRGRTGP
ncbi:DUF1731 domain-containing protein [Umezawaea sp. Da 62-37]|uniref:epimerase n=1 Tax=Umezawaea sp. Da 62-37 TaxID=3075927 RepID=UPI0028F74618|nr:DUF1731 domain-containing protein [Umezawaea sp. Da 62-37]WNV87167.1 DUF1731 domain-containing protein [Umezawaea sp. Da 62-37]